MAQNDTVVQGLDNSQQPISNLAKLIQQHFERTGERVTHVDFEWIKAKSAGPGLTFVLTNYTTTTEKTKLA